MIACIVVLVETFNPYPAPKADKRYVMGNFYREMRRHFAVLMEDDCAPAAVPGISCSNTKNGCGPIPV